MAEYVPGCYRNLESHPDESLSGYLLRLAEANGYAGIRSLLDAAGMRRLPSLRLQLLRLHADHLQLAHIARMAVGDPSHLDRYFCEPLPPATFGNPMEALFRLNRRVDIDAVLPERSAVCLACLRENGYAREEWDLAFVTGCAVHQVLLVDECPECHSPLTWERSLLSHCTHCLQDLRVFEAHPMTGRVAAVALDFAALAPFRLTDHRGQTHTVDWDEMFKACKALLLPEHLWAAHEFPAIFVAQTALAARQQLIDGLAAAHRNARYRMSEFSWKARQALAPFSAIPVPAILDNLASHYLETEVGLSREFASAMLRYDPPSHRTAVDAFGTALPSAATLEELCGLLGASTEEVTCLLSLRVIRPKLKSAAAYDADDVLAARGYLASLIGPKSLSEIAGVQVTGQDLSSGGLFPRWNPRSRTDDRVALERLVELQRTLIVRWHRAETPRDPTSVNALAVTCDRPVEAVTAIVKDISMGTITRFKWNPPFTWSDIVVDRSDLGAISRLLS